MNCPNCDVVTIESVVDNKPHFQCPKCPFNHCEGDGLLETLYVWVSYIPKTGAEGIMAINDKGVVMAAVTSKLEIARKMGSRFRETSEKTGIQMRLLQFSNRHVIDEIKQME